MEFQPVFECFAALLKERLQAGVFTTEDSLRYTFFLALIETGYCRHVDIILEEPHPTIPGAEVDLRIANSKDRLSTAFEFKFDRAIPSQRNLPRTQKAGAVFKDLFRLARIPSNIAPQRFFIYFTTPEMAGYFCNPANHLTRFFNLILGERYLLPPNFILSQAPTFQSVCGALAVSCEVVGSYQHLFETKEVLKIFQVSSE